MDRGAWRAAVCRLTKSQKRLKRCVYAQGRVGKKHEVWGQAAWLLILAPPLSGCMTLDKVLFCSSLYNKEVSVSP